MIQLGRIFQKGMILQRRKPIHIWGESTCDELVSVWLNEDEICTLELKKGPFDAYLPPQEALENAIIRIGDIVLDQVDIGDIYIAGGQSNMEFKLKFDAEYESAIKYKEDLHLRYYEVGKYDYKEEIDDILIKEDHWDTWMHWKLDSAPDMSAIAFYFAKEIREKYNVPIGIISCNYGGTTASTWLDPTYLSGDLSTYLEEYENETKNIDLNSYIKQNRKNRLGMRSEQSKAMMEAINYGGNRLKIFMDELKASMPALDDKTIDEGRALMDKMGPHNKNRPGGLFETMVNQIVGFTVVGVLWYQGETDEKHPTIYAQLFTALIHCWRNVWKELLPFYFVQLAPFGTWMGGNGEKYPVLRNQQAEVEKTVDQVYMITSSDVGDLYDVHPKKKKPLGHRLALQVMKHGYGEPLLSEYPSPQSITVTEEKITVKFQHSNGLYVKGEKINDLDIIVDGESVLVESFSCDDESLTLLVPNVNRESIVEVHLAQTGYYDVNLYNSADIPAAPFILKSKDITVGDRNDESNS